MTQQAVTQQKFLKSEAFRYAWKMTKKHFLFLLAVLIIPAAINYVFLGVTNFLVHSYKLPMPIGLLISVVRYVVGLELNIATLIILLQIVDKKKTSLKNLFAYFDPKLLWRYFVITFIYEFGIFVGTILLIVPGVYVGVKYLFAIPLVIDKGMGISEALHESAKMTKGVKKNLVVFALLQTLLLIAGVLAFIVGLVIALPVVLLSYLYVYRKLSPKA